MDIRKVKKLIDLVNTTNISELEIHEGEESVKITHGKAQATYVPSTPPTIEIMKEPETIPETSKVEPPEKIEEPTGHTVKSPMVGTIFLAPSPGIAPFVEIGQRVSAGDTICIIEAMKMFNQVEADKAGVISACMVENSQPVEYDQPLFIIE